MPIRPGNDPFRAESLPKNARTDPEKLQLILLRGPWTPDVPQWVPAATRTDSTSVQFGILPFS
jgi:hypothetical protein